MNSIFKECCGKSIILLIDDIYNELLKFLDNNFCTEFKYIVNSLYDYSLKDLVKINLKLKRLNLPSTDNNIKNIYKKQFLALLSTKNNLKDGDSHAIGQNLSIDLYCKAAQNTLNVKRLNINKDLNIINSNDIINNKFNIEVNLKNTNTYSTVEDIKTNFSRYIKFNFPEIQIKKIIPNINVTILYSCEINENDVWWIRLKIKETLKISNIITNLKKNNINLFGISKISDTIYEFYFNNKYYIKYFNFLSNLSDVIEIIFFSNLKLFKHKLHSCNLTILSNIIKFYYCYLNYSNDFSIRNNDDIFKLSKIYLYSSIFLFSDNMNISTSEKCNAPLTCLSGNNPNTHLKLRSKYIEPLSEYDLTILNKKQTDNSEFAKNLKNKDKIDELLDIRISPYSYDSLKVGSKHRIYSINQDRDFKMISHPGLIGGHNLHEVVVYKNIKTDVIDINKSNSKKLSCSNILNSF